MSQPFDPNQTVDETPQPDSVAGGVAVPPNEDAAPTRLVLLEEIARGGMGAILRGRDGDFGRDVAVKVLREDHQDRAELTQRFLEEARIAGRLQHPGVVPVYSLGWLPDGRPYFTMKLVKGRTLAALMAERKEPGQDRPRFLAVFEQVCQTLAYAHSKDVIHRDLKPANIMVGAFGEVQVMDWGLAKVLTRDAAADGERPDLSAEVSAIRTPRSEGSDTPQGGSDTRAGTVLGTPAYMAPEQARGETDKVDERSDVFGLGAILCAVLTGRPPFAGPGVAAQERAARGDLADAFVRLDGSGADVDLIALAKRCLAPEPAERPCDAREVAAAVTAYRESVERRLRQAEVANAEAKVKVIEGRKRRRVALALAASVLLTALVVGGGWGWWTWERAARRATAERAADVALGQADQAAEQARGIDEAADKAGDVEPETPETAKKAAGLWRQALASVEEAGRALAAAPDGAARGRLAARRQVVDAGVERAEKEARLLGDLDRARALRASESALDWESAARSYAAALEPYGAGTAGGEGQASSAVRAERPAVRLALIVALDDWAVYVSGPETARLHGVADGADDDAWRRRYRAAALAGDVSALKRLAEEARGQDLPAVSTCALAVALTVGNAPAEAAALLRQARLQHPADYWLHLYLGYSDLLTGLVDRSHQNPATLNEAADSFYTAIALRPDSAMARADLGFVLDIQGDWEGSVVCYKKAIELDPKSASAYYSLGIELAVHGNSKAAAEYLKKASELAPKDTMSAMVQYDLGTALAGLGNPGGAAQYFKKAIELDPKFAAARVELVKVLAPQGRLEEARAAWGTALEHEPSDHEIWYGYAELCLFLGRDQDYRRNRSALLNHFGDTADPTVAERTVRACLLLPAAGDDLARAAALADRAAAAGPKHGYYAYFLATKGLAEYRRGRFDVAIDALQQAGARGVWMPVTRPVLAMALYRSGRTREAREALAAAVKSYDWDDAKADDQDKWIAHVLRREAEELIVPNLSAYLKGEYQPKDNSERLELIDPCRFRKRYLSASRLYADALAADPKLADDALSGNRYNAACSAARAGCGQGEGAKDLDAKERARWRKQALDWLRADLALWAKQLDSDKPEDRKTVVEMLRHWQRDADLAGLRDAAALAKLPADEREAGKKLWADVQALLDKADGKK